ncbi:hypothetical protein M3Y95_00307300 [Aphelenchoides besseyi]|nr:hypothetical protein M3Y95_00307300 [Aphelenchoides besseyi]
MDKCQAIKADGNRCTFAAKKNGYCGVHSKKSRTSSLSVVNVREFEFDPNPGPSGLNKQDEAFESEIDDFELYELDEIDVAEEMAAEMEANCRIENKVQLTVEEVGPIESWVMVVGVQIPADKIKVLKVLTESHEVSNSLTPVDGNQLFIQFDDPKAAFDLIETRTQKIQKNTICLFPATIQDLTCSMLSTEELYTRTEALVHAPTHVTQKRSFSEWPSVSEYMNGDKQKQKYMTENLVQIFDNLFNPQNEICIKGVKELIAKNTDPVNQRKFQKKINQERQKFMALSGVQQCYFLDLIEMWSSQQFCVSIAAREGFMHPVEAVHVVHFLSNLQPSALTVENRCWKRVNQQGDERPFLRGINRLPAARALIGIVYGWETITHLQASHLCGRRWCLNPNHIYPETFRINRSREICFIRSSASTCFHGNYGPRCMFMDSDGVPTCRNNPNLSSCQCGYDCFAVVVHPDQLREYVDIESEPTSQLQEEFFGVSQCYRCVEKGNTDLKFISVQTRLCANCRGSVQYTHGTCSICRVTKRVRKSDCLCENCRHEDQFCPGICSSCKEFKQIRKTTRICEKCRRKCEWIQGSCLRCGEIKQVRKSTGLCSRCQQDVYMTRGICRGCGKTKQIRKSTGLCSSCQDEDNWTQEICCGCGETKRVRKATGLCSSCQDDNKWSEGSCWECGETKRVRKSSGLCRRCEREGEFTQAMCTKCKETKRIHKKTRLCKRCESEAEFAQGECTKCRETKRIRRTTQLCDRCARAHCHAQGICSKCKQTKRIRISTQLCDRCGRIKD